MSMREDPILRFLPGAIEGDPRRILGLPPAGSLDATMVETAMRERLEEILLHPDHASPEAEQARALVRRAAQTLLMAMSGGTVAGGAGGVPQGMGPLSAPTKTAGTESAGGRFAGRPRRVAASHPGAVSLALTDFDRQVLAVLVANGGWNSRSRAQLVSLAMARGVTVQGLLRVILGLARYARGRGKPIGIREIAGRAAQAGVPFSPRRAGGLEAGRGAAPGQAVAAGAAVKEAVEEELAPEDRLWRAIRLPLLFGLITILGGIIVLRIALAPDGPSPPRPQGTNTVAATTTTAPVDAATTEKTATTPEHLFFRSPPTFLGNGLPLVASQAADSMRMLPEGVQDIANHVEVGEHIALPQLNAWKADVDTVATGWFLADESTRAAAFNALIGVLRVSSAETAEELMKALSPVQFAPGADAVDLWRSTWRAGFLTTLAGHQDLPHHVVENARRRLKMAIGEPFPELLSFANGARAYLGRQVETLIATSDESEASRDAWELWLGAHRALDDAATLDDAMLDVVEQVLKAPGDLAAPGPLASVVGRFVNQLRLDSPAVRERVLMLLDDDGMSTADARVLSAILALDDRTIWMPDELVIPDDANAMARTRLRDRIAAVWPSGTPTDTAPQGAGVTVDPTVGQRWLAASDHALDVILPSDELASARLLLAARRVNEAAAQLAAGAPLQASAILDELDRAWPVIDAQTTGPDVAASRPALQPGQAIGPDGQWSAQYENTVTNKDQHLQVLRSLRTIAGTDLGPTDAATFVREVYRGPTQEIRASAQAILAEQFSAGPNVMGQLLEQFNDAIANEDLSAAIQQATGGLMPSVKSETWSAEARLAIVERLLMLRGVLPGEADRIAMTIAASLSRSQGAFERDTILPGDDVDEAAEGLVAAMRRHAATLLSSDPVPAPLPDLAQRSSTRMALAEGPLQRFVGQQVTMAELLAYITAAEQPAARETVNGFLDASSRLRSRAGHVLQQAVLAERAQVELWRVRLVVAGASKASREVDGAGETHVGAIVPAIVVGLIGVPEPWFQQTAPAEESAGRQDWAPWAERLAALRPGDPLAYLELGEDVMDAAKNDAQRNLARRLFGLAGALAPERLGRSACLALAQTAPTSLERRRLLALASLLEGPAALQRPMLQGEQSSAEAALAVVQAIEFYRMGQGPRALTALKKPGATPLIEAIGALLPGGLNRFMQDCNLYHGQLRPTLSPAEVDRLLQLEHALLADAHRPWSDDLLLVGGLPLVEVDPANLAQSLGVDGERCEFRNGQWVKPDVK